MSEHNATIEGTIIALLDGKKYQTLKDILSTMNGADIAGVFEDLDEKRIPLLFRLIPKELAAETFVEMNPEYQELLIKGFSDKELKDVIEELYVDDAVDLVEDMPANVVKRILSQADPQMRREINEILRYPENSAGSIMTTEYISLHPDMSVDEALSRIRQNAVDKETIYTCYVTLRRKLIGVVTLKDLLVVKEDSTRISDIMDKNIIAVHTGDDREDIVQMLSKYNFLALPVLDSDDHMVGIITFDDAMDVMEEEATEDIEKMAAILPSEKDYLRSNSWDLFRQRIPWLLLLMVSATFTGMIITKFENALAAQVVLTAFIPMLMDTGGNSGAQSSVTVIRAISLGELTFKNLPAVIWKEIKTAVLCGFTLSVACFAKIILIDKLLLGNEAVSFTIAFVVCFALGVTVLVAKIVGCTLPMIADRLGFDPAVMSSPFITTIVDALSLLVFFAFASAILFR